MNCGGMMFVINKIILQLDYIIIDKKFINLNDTIAYEPEFCFY